MSVGDFVAYLSNMCYITFINNCSPLSFYELEPSFEQWQYNVFITGIKSSILLLILTLYQDNPYPNNLIYCSCRIPYLFTIYSVIIFY
jgi:hypothetical protein